MSDPTQPVRSMIDKPCIQVIAHGSTYDVTYEEFAKGEIQERSFAAEVAQRMLDGDDPYQWNDDEPEFYTEFVVTDRDVLAAALREQEES